MRVLFAIVALCVVSSALAAPLDLPRALVNKAREMRKAGIKDDGVVGDGICADGCAATGDSSCLFSGPLYENGACVLNDVHQVCCQTTCCRIEVPEPEPVGGEATWCAATCSNDGDASCELSGVGFPHGVCILNAANTICCDGACCAPRPNFCHTGCSAEGDESVQLSGPGFPNGVCVLDPAAPVACDGQCCFYDADNLVAPPADPDNCPNGCDADGDATCIASSVAFPNGVCAANDRLDTCCNGKCCIHVGDVPPPPTPDNVCGATCPTEGGDMTCVLAGPGFPNGVCVLTADTTCCNRECCTWVPGVSGIGEGTGSGGSGGTAMN